MSRYFRPDCKILLRSIFVLKEGDRVLEVNGVPVGDLKADEIARLLAKSENGCVTFKLMPAEVPHAHLDHSTIHLRAQVGLNCLFSRTGLSTVFLFKTLLYIIGIRFTLMIFQFDYDGSSDPRHPCPEAALSFSKGDILELLVCSDEHWWQVSKTYCNL